MDIEDIQVRIYDINSEIEELQQMALNTEDESLKESCYQRIEELQQEFASIPQDELDEALDDSIDEYRDSYVSDLGYNPEELEDWQIDSIMENGEIIEYEDFPD